MRREIVGPSVELAQQIGLVHHVLRLVVAVLLPPPELREPPQRVRHFDAAIPALPDQRCVRVTHVLEGLRPGIEVLGMAQDPGPAFRVQLIAPAVAIAEERGGPALEVVTAQLPPPGRVLQPDSKLGVLVGDEVFPRVASIHADQPVEHRLEVAAHPVPVDRSDDGPGIRQIQARVQVQIPHQVGLAPAARFVAVARPDAERHRGRDAPVAGPDLLPVPDVAEIFEVDLPSLRQPVRHAQHECAGFGIDARTIVLPPIRARDEKDSKGPGVGSKPAVRVLWLQGYKTLRP